MSLHTLYNGRVQLEMDEVEHEYSVSVDGAPAKQADGVTGVTSFAPKPALVPWAVKLATDFLQAKLWTVHGDKEAEKELIKQAKNEHKRVRDESATYGTSVHLWVEEFIELQMGLRSAIRETANGSEQAFVGWHQQMNPEYLHSEKKVYSIENNFAGTTDMIAKFPEHGTIVVDAKTSNSIWVEHILQLSAYWGAQLEEHGRDYLNGGGLLHLEKNGKADFLVFPESVMSKAYVGFIHLLKFKRIFTGLEKLI